jgi:hypothetical protein
LNDSKEQVQAELQGGTQIVLSKAGVRRIKIIKPQIDSKNGVINIQKNLISATPCVDR